MELSDCQFCPFVEYAVNLEIVSMCCKVVSVVFQCPLDFFNHRMVFASVWYCFEGWFYWQFNFFACRFVVFATDIFYGCFGCFWEFWQFESCNSFGVCFCLVCCFCDCQFDPDIFHWFSQIVFEWNGVFLGFVSRFESLVFCSQFWCCLFDCNADVFCWIFIIGTSIEGYFCLICVWG